MIPEMLRILVVSESEATHKASVSALRQMGIAVESRQVTTGSALSRQFRQGVWDAVIYDSLCTGCSPRELPSSLAGNDGNPPVFIIVNEGNAALWCNNQEFSRYRFLRDNEIIRLPLLLLEEIICFQKKGVTNRAASEDGRRYRLMLDDQSELICQYTRDGIVTFSNRAFQRFYGLSGAGAVGGNVFDLLPQDECDRIKLQIFALPPGDVTGEIVHRAIRYDGAERWIERRERAIPDGQGRVSRFQSICRDITERRQIEKALRDSEARFRDFAAVSSDWLWETGPDMCFTYVSDQVRKELGYGPRLFIGRTRAALHAADAPELDSFEEYRDHVRARRPYRNLIYAVRLPDERLEYIRHNGMPIFDADGLFRGYRGSSSRVTDTVESQRALRQAEERLRYAISSLSEAFAIFDSEGHLLSANQPFQDSLPEEAPPGTPWKEIVTAFARAGFFAEIEGTPEERAARILARTGPDRLLEISDTDGRWYRIEERGTRDGGFVFIRTDITELKLSESKYRALANQNAKFAAVIEETASGVMMCDACSPGNPVVWTNRAFTHLTGFEARDVIGKSLFCLQGPGTDPEALQKLVEAIQTERPARLEILNYKSNGTPFWNEMSVTPIFDEKDRLDSWVAILTDISERKFAVEQLMALADENARFAKAIAETPSGVVILESSETGELVISFVNRAFSRFTGYPFDVCVGQDIRFLEGENTDPAMAEGLAAALAGARSFRTEILHYRRDGRPFWNEISIGPILAEGGRASSFVCVCNDISDRRRIEDQLRQSQKMEVIGQLTGGIAHDFNNLLTIMAGNLQLLADDVSRIREDPSRLLEGDSQAQLDDCGELVEEALSAARQASDVTKGLLTFSRQKSMELRPVDVNRQMDHATALLRRTLGEGVRIRVDPAPALPLALCDSGQLEAAVLNLALNARDAMAGSGELTIATELLPASTASLSCPIPDSGSFVCLSVRDTGCGIPSDLIDRVLEPLFTTKAQGKGTGLGLTMVQRFVNSTGGELQIESQEGNGTVVKLFLPVGPESEQSVIGAEIAELPRGTETILIVDDEERIRRFARRCLENLGYQVEEAGDGAEALDFLRTRHERIDALFTDIKMPRCTGAELVAAMQENWPEIRVLMATGSPGSEDHARILLGPDIPILSKPYSRRDLAMGLRAVLDESRPGHK